ncbi:MAG: long-chain fatty acid transporter FadL [Enterobacteriaceae bacterium]
MRRIFRLKPLLLALPCSLLSFYSHAAGFQLNESSASGLGRAFAGEAAIGDNAAIGSRNPAGMMLFSAPAFSGGVTYINPNIDLEGTSPAPFNNSLKHKDIAPSAWVPNLHIIYPVSDKWAMGFSATSNFGLATDFPKNYPAGPLAGKTNLTTVNFNLNSAWRLDSNWSFGLGVDAVYADAEITRHAGEAMPMKASELKADSTIAKLTGDDWGYGWNAGLLYEFDQDNRLGLAYRSKVDIKFKGRYSSDIPNKYNASQAKTQWPWGTDGNSIPANLTLNLPAIWEFSGYHRVLPQWAVHYSASYVTWKRFKELKATDSDHVLFYKDESFKNAYRLALGGTHYLDKNWTLRAGFAFDQTPIPASHRSISIPDQRRLWYSAGVTYAFTPQASVDFGVSYMRGQKVTIREQSGPLPYTFKATGEAWLSGVNLNYQF